MEALASSIGEEPYTLEDVYEPYLLQIGFLNRTPRGRVITSKGLAHLRKHQGRDKPIAFSVENLADELKLSSEET